ncbi:hypothetical protein ALQ33_200142 [Pseudomonas syringae pv. philadelphi]|uniref:Tail fiber protein H n=1 Tax=Pseudomonas syringae pv. philadelphi TaxID=251706 RepID=A0A3M3YCB8_9PSED|nr:phage tail protein [Pseudomonas syringae group genomosp. 3]RMO79781.1 hypothetical protein ALQ33_200142 [Pseudomonas syringae pv. philadelphi]
MAADFYTILTNAGINYEVAAKAAGTPIKLAKMSVGDGGGSVYNPDATATALRREVWRGEINALIQDKSNPNWLVAELVIPDSVGGWSVREAGIWTDTGVLYAIVKYPESFKPVLASGAAKEFYVRSIFQTSNAPNVTLVVDESIVKATRAWVVDYVQAELAKLDWKKSVRAVATSQVALTGAQTVDGVALVTGDRVLVTAQASARENGLYVVANDAWLRADDANLNIEVTANLFVLVEEGSQFGDSAWQLVTNSPIVLGTTSLSFEMAFGRTGIAAGSYKQVAVDKYGRVTAGFNPSTLSGYGIQDAFTKTETAKAVSDAVAALVASSPAALDTLNELAAAIGGDANFAATMNTALAQKANSASPLFTGNPRAPTPLAGDNSTSVSTTAFTRLVMALFGLGSDTATAMADANDVPLSGMYRMNTDGANLPMRANSTLLNMRYNNGGALQLVGALDGSGGLARLFWRTQAAGGFTAWREVGGLDSPVFTGSPKAPTVAFNTEDDRLATMAAIGEAKQAYRGVGSGYTASETLGPDAVGRWHRINVPGITITLPPKGSVGVGKTLTFHNSSSGAATIKANGTDVMSLYGSGSGTLQLGASEWIELAFNSDAIYVLKRGKIAETAALDSPAFIGNPTVPTAAVGDNDMSAANTAFVQAAMAFYGVGSPNATLSTDLNNAVAGGFFKTNSDTKNAPWPSNLSVITVPYNSGGCLQVAALLSSGTVGEIAFRTQAGSSWSAWKKLAATDSPSFTGTPTCPSPAAGDDSQQIVNTQFFKSELSRLKTRVRFTANTTWTCPPGITLGWLSGCAGGGGGGGGAGLSSNGSGGGSGGGAGQSVISEPFTLVPGTVYTITIGAGGSGAATAASGVDGRNGTAGGVTRFGSLLALAGGGLGSGGNTSSGAGGYASSAGGGGATDGSDAGAPNAGGDGGSGGGGPYGTAGGGGRAGSGGGASGRPGSGYGTGGGGGGAGYAGNNAIGGAGTAGQPGMLILEF